MPRAESSAFTDAYRGPVRRLFVMVERCGRSMEVSTADWARTEAIDRLVAGHDRNPRPFVRTVDPDALVEKVRSGL